MGLLSFSPFMRLPFLFMLSAGWAAAQSLESVLTPEQLAKANHALEHPGDVKAGEELFHDQSRLSCTVCHQIYGREIHKPAPNLFGMGDKFTPTELIRAIEKPSAFIMPGFETTQITTKAGDTHIGILRSVSTKSGYSLKDVSGKTHQIAHQEVADRTFLDFSLMPEGLMAGLTKEDYADVIAFLLAQRTTGLAAVSGQDEPTDIVILEEPVRLEPYHSSDLEFVAPVFMTLRPGTTHEFMVIEHQAGKIWRLIDTEGHQGKVLFLDISDDRELGADRLVGLAFHPNYAENRKYYIKYGAKESNQLKIIIEERLATADGLKDSEEPPRRLLEVEQPAGNHNGGHLTFGPDGYLYTAFGDGGPQKDPNGHSQNLGSFLGAMLRIDVDSQTDAKPYGIPADNPFLGQKNVLPEIWAYGFREPWQFSFDDNGDLWLGDVGQVTWEEVALVSKGENHGWNVREAFDPFSKEYQRPDTSYASPIFAYGRQLGTSVTGGHVYRGDKSSPLYGYYIFGDHESRRLFAINYRAGKLKEVYELGFSPQRVSAFAKDAFGEMYLLGYQGTIYRLALSSIDLTPRGQR